MFCIISILVPTRIGISVSLNVLSSKHTFCHSLCMPARMFSRRSYFLALSMFSFNSFKLSSSCTDNIRTSFSLRSLKFSLLEPVMSLICYQWRSLRDLLHKTSITGLNSLIFLSSAPISDRMVLAAEFWLPNYFCSFCIERIDSLISFSTSSASISCKFDSWSSCLLAIRASIFIQSS